MALSSNLGFPRIGPKRELKKALEEFWAGKRGESDLLEAARAIRRGNWQMQKEAGLDMIPSNDFSFYDHVLDTAVMAGAIPSRYGWSGGSVDLRTYFAMARGLQEKTTDGKGTDLPAMEMTKWFDTNYHFIVPEFTKDQRFTFSSSKAVDELNEAKALGIATRPVLLGPVSFLLLGKSKDAGFDRLSLLGALLPVYDEALRRLAEAGATWIQMDEPCLALDLDAAAHSALAKAYAALEKASRGMKLLVATYFEGLRENLPIALKLPVAALHLDLVRAPGQLDAALAAAPASLSLSLGVIDGRNIWKTDLERALGLVDKAVKAVGKDRVLIAPSCSLLHSPVDLDVETGLDEELRSWLAFSKQKLQEVVTLARAVNEGPDAVKVVLAGNREAMQRRRTSPRIHSDAVKQRVSSVNAGMLRRRSAYSERRRLQQQRLRLPLFPTTTIGSFPQTGDVRGARAEFKAGKRDAAAYESFLKQEIERTIRFQEEIGLDVLVHGEFERNDMVEYFGEQLPGFAFTKNGWVQSYGSRYVKPPMIFGDVHRPKAMTVEWSRFAQSLTQKPVKGMLTGPVTILQWSFVRDDQPRSETCRQVALAIRDEAIDLEAAGIKAVQIDEPALREGLPLRRNDWNGYLKWAVECFRLASSGVKDDTQIHTHMCYAEFNEIMESIAAMDADVISMETSRSQSELFSALKRYHYPNEIGPGVYDIHSPRVPSREEMVALLRRALEVLKPQQLWVNPDCGLKTRRWEEVRPALTNMVQSAKELRSAVTA